MSKKIAKEIKKLLKKSQAMRDELAGVLSTQDKGDKPIVAIWGADECGQKLSTQYAD